MPTGGDLWWTRVELGREGDERCSQVFVESQSRTPVEGCMESSKEGALWGALKCRFFCCILGSPCRVLSIPVEPVPKCSS